MRIFPSSNTSEATRGNRDSRISSNIDKSAPGTLETTASNAPSLEEQITSDPGSTGERTPNDEQSIGEQNTNDEPSAGDQNTNDAESTGEQAANDSESKGEQNTNDSESAREQTASDEPSTEENTTDVTTSTREQTNISSPSTGEEESGIADTPPPRTISLPGNRIEVVILVSTAPAEDDEIELVHHHFVKPTSGNLANTDCDHEGNNEIAVVDDKEVVNVLKDYAHPRPSCAVFAFSEDEEEKKQFCGNCFCVRCEVRASDCTDWENHHRMPIEKGINIS